MTPHPSMVSLPADLLEALADHVTVAKPDEVPTVAAAVAYAKMVLGRHKRRELFDRLRGGEHVSLEDLVDGTDDHGDRLPVPRWDYVFRATTLLERTVVDDPGNLALADALGAYVRERFDALGLSMRNPETIYVVVVTAALLVELADNGRTNEQVDAETVRAIASISQALTVALLPYMPEEIRRRG